MKSRALWGFTLAAFLPALALLGGCSPADDGSDTTIKIVSSMPRTGSAKAQTDTVVNGIRMALEEVGWKIGPFTLEYLDWDDATAAFHQGRQLPP